MSISKYDKLTDTNIDDFLSDLNIPDIPVPDRLKPENIDSLLDTAEVNLETHRRHKKQTIAICSTAACITIVAGCVFGSGTLHYDSSSCKSDSPQPTSICIGSDGDDYNYRKLFDALNSTTEQHDSLPANQGADKVNGTKSEIFDSDQDTSFALNNNYVFCLHDGEVLDILKKDNDTLSLVNSIELSTMATSIYVNNNTLYVYSYSEEEMCLDLYDVTDVANPKKIYGITQSGQLLQASLYKNKLYTFTSFTVSYTTDSDDYSSYVPRINNSYIPNSNIHIDTTHGKNIIVASIIDIETQNLSGAEAFLTDYSTISMDYNNCYISDYSSLMPGYRLSFSADTFSFSDCIRETSKSDEQEDKTLYTDIVSLCINNNSLKNNTFVSTLFPEFSNYDDDNPYSYRFKDNCYYIFDTATKNLLNKVECK